MIDFQRTFRVALALTCLAWAGSLWAADDERDVAIEINRANELLRGGDVDAAVEAYRHLLSKAADRADLSYNMAAAQYRKGEMAAAEQLFNQVSSADDDVLAARARYNLGNCNYASALQLAEADQSAAIQRFQKAIESYRGALEIDPNDTDSRANIELAAAMIDKLQNQHKQQQQQQQQNQTQDQQQQDEQQQDEQHQIEQQQNQQPQDGDQDDQKQESSQQSSSEQQQNSQQQNSQQQTNRNQQQSQQNQQQQPKSESPQSNESRGQSSSQEKPQDTGDDSKQWQPPPDNSQTDSAGDKQPAPPQNQSSRPSSQQRSTQQRPQQDETQQPDQPHDQKGSAAPKGALTTADQKTGKSAQQDKNLAAEPEAVPNGAMTIQEAEKMLQAIRDQEMIRRLRRQAAERNARVPVDRDW
jgi:Ca-activated chloride channel family protein